MRPCVAVDRTQHFLFGVSVRKMPPVYNVGGTLSVGWSSGPQAAINKLAISLLEQLHWLPIERRIKFKIVCITNNIYHAACLSALYSILKRYRAYVPSFTQRSSDYNLLLSVVSEHVSVLIVSQHTLPPFGIFFHVWFSSPTRSCFL